MSLTQSATARIFNFSAGPAVLPVSVLERVQDELLALPGRGISVLEISHRSATFDQIAESAESDLRRLAGIPDDYRVLFLQGGASMQFAMVPMNLLPTGATADYIVTGSWSQKALREAQRIGMARVAGSTEPDSFSRIPRQDELDLTPDAAYHVTSNNTIRGTQWSEVPDVGDVPLVCDACSDILSRPIDITRYGLVYAGAQKNLAPAGLTLVIIRDDLVVTRTPTQLPAMLQYAVHAEHHSHYNTPPVFTIYVMGLVLRWMLDSGGLEAIAAANDKKAGWLYDEIDRSGFYRGTAQRGSRSLMNVTFRLPSEELEQRFVQETADAGLSGLKGHRSVGGIRASLYNACPAAAVKALVEFMRKFERTHG